MIKKEKLGKGFIRISITPDELAKELVRQNRKFGSASGGIQRLAIKAARRKFVIKDPAFVDLVFLPPEGKLAFEWGWQTENSIYQNWASGTQRGDFVPVEGYTFTYSHPYAGLPGTIGIAQEPRRTFAGGRISSKPTVRITPKTPRLRK